MLGAIAGDIIGSRFEGHPGPPPDFELFHPNCRFTDDTVCTVAVADALLGDRDFAASLRSFVRRHPHRGYGGMFIDWAFSDDAPPTAAGGMERPCARQQWAGWHRQRPKCWIWLQHRRPSAMIIRMRSRLLRSSLSRSFSSGRMLRRQRFASD